jgi:hypothetical protein
MTSGPMPSPGMRVTLWEVIESLKHLDIESFNGVLGRAQ